MFPKPTCASPRGLVRARIVQPHQLGVGGKAQICVLTKFLGDADIVGSATPLSEPLLEATTVSIFPGNLVYQ